MGNWRVTESDYTFLEDEVRLYPLYEKRLREIEIDLMLATPIRDDNGGGKSNIPGRPVERIVITLFADARIQRLRKIVDAVQFALEELDPEKERFIRFVFWNRDGKNIQRVLKEFNVSQQTYNRWKKAFLMRVGMITGDYRGDL
jgi:RinA family phage transcriptional activator